MTVVNVPGITMVHHVARHSGTGGPGGGAAGGSGGAQYWLGGTGSAREEANATIKARERCRMMWVGGSRLRCRDAAYLQCARQVCKMLDDVGSDYPWSGRDTGQLLGVHPQEFARFIK